MFTCMQCCWQAREEDYLPPVPSGGIVDLYGEYGMAPESELAESVSTTTVLLLQQKKKQEVLLYAMD